MALLLGPVVWAIQPLRHPTDGSDPRAGPAPSRANTAAQVDAVVPALRWIEARAPGVRYPLALTSTADAGAWVVAGGRSVVGLGGFFGNEPIPPMSRLHQLIRSGQIGYVLVDPTASTPTIRLIRSTCVLQTGHALPLATADLLYWCHGRGLTKEVNSHGS